MTAPRLLKSVTAASATSPILRCALGQSAEAPGQERQVQVTISSAGSVQVQGRLTSDMAWANVGSAITATGIATVPAYPEMQLVLSGNNGTVDATIQKNPGDNIVLVVTSAASGSQDEDIADSATISTVVARTCGTPAFSMHSNPGNLFEVHATTGVVSLATGAALDAETATEHVLQIKVYDPDADAYAVHTFTLTVNDVLDESPVITSAASVSVNEDIADETTFYTATADKDIGATLTWSITADPSGLFQINSGTGVVQLINASGGLDHETTESYACTISVTDGTTTPDTLDLTINVADVSEAGPTFTSASSYTYDEHTLDSRILFQAAATPDVAGTAVTYAINTDIDNLFRIEPATGRVRLQVGKAFDYETATSHNVTIEADDGTSQNTQVVTINVTDAFDYI